MPGVNIPPEIVAADAEISRLFEAAHAKMAAVEPLLLGRIVKRDGFTYKVTRVGMALGHIDLSGKRVAKNGNDGSREFHIGFATLTEFVA